MPISENMVQEIVQEVMAKMQIAEAPAGKHGIFKDMNDAIEAAKKAELIVKRMSMDQREKIITCIRKKIKENAEVLARMGVEETGMGNVGDKILKHHLVADKTPGTEDITTTAWSGDRGLTPVSYTHLDVYKRQRPPSLRSHDASSTSAVLHIMSSASIAATTPVISIKPYALFTSELLYACMFVSVI